MKDHNEHYEGLSFTVEVTNNGFLIKNNNMTVTGWKTKHFKDFIDLVETLASSTGLMEIGERVRSVETFKQ